MTKFEKFYNELIRIIFTILIIVMIFIWAGVYRVISGKAMTNAEFYILISALTVGFLSSVLWIVSSIIHCLKIKHSDSHKKSQGRKFNLPSLPSRKEF